MRGAVLTQKRAKAAMGNLNNKFRWAPMKPETIARKANGNMPLVETGELGDSIEVDGPFRETNGASAVVGTNHRLAVIHELGTARILARSFIGAATFSAEEEIQKFAQRQVAKAFAGGHAYHELKELLHLAHKVSESGNQLVESFGEDESKG